jgi:hypothetical protein
VVTMAPPGSSRPSLTYTDQTLEASLPAITPCLKLWSRQSAYWRPTACRTKAPCAVVRLNAPKTSSSKRSTKIVFSFSNRCLSESILANGISFSISRNLSTVATIFASNAGSGNSARFFSRTKDVVYCRCYISFASTKLQENPPKLRAQISAVPCQDAKLYTMIDQSQLAFL